MVNINNIRSKINNVLNRDEINRNIVIIKYDYTEDEYGDVQKEFFCQDVVKAIVLDYKQLAPKYDPAGKYSQATAIVLIPYNYKLSDKDELIIGDDEYVIIYSEPIMIGEKIVFYRVFVQKKILDTDNSDY